MRIGCAFLLGVAASGMASLGTGCANPGEPAPSEDAVVLDVVPEVGASGASLTLILENESQSDIGYDLCASELEHLSNGGWAPVETDHVCTLAIRPLRPGEEARFPVTLPEALTTGEYRFATSIHDVVENGESHEVRSEVFWVID